MEAKDTTPVALFEATCEALGVPVGARRVEAYLRLPDAERVAIEHELVAEAEDVTIERGP
jgi:hypothetical protein